MTTPETVAEKLEETRSFLLKLWGRERYDRTISPIVAAVRTIAAKTGETEFGAAIRIVREAAAEHASEIIIWQMTAAACEIAEGRSK